MNRRTSRGGARTERIPSSRGRTRVGAAFGLLLALGGTLAFASPDESPGAPLPPPGFLKSCLQQIQHGDYDGARRRLEPVVAAHPGWSRAHLYLGLTYHMEHRYEPARELFDAALRLDPKNHPTRVYLGWALYYLGQLDESREMFESYLAAKPDYPDAIFAIGLIDFDADDLDAAAERFERAIELAVAGRDAGTEAKARARLADVLIRRDQWERARKELERSLALNPDNHEAHFKLSRVLERLGDAEGAERARADHRRTLEERNRNRRP